MRNHLCYPLLPLAILMSDISWADHPTVGLGGNASDPITTSSAYTLAKGEAAVSLDFQWIDMDPVSNARLAGASARGESVHSSGTVSRTALDFSLGLNDRLSVGISLPWVERQSLKEAAHPHHEEGEDEDEHGDEDEAGSISQLGDANGRGDIQLSSVYRLAGNWGDGSAALLLGIKAPTGKTHEKNRSAERLETELQPGSGSWDYSLGLAFSRREETWTVDSNILYTLTTEGSQETDLGNIINYNLSLSRPLKYRTKNAEQIDDHDHSQHVHASAPPGPAITAHLILEFNGEWRDRIEINGIEEQNSGGNLIYFSPGIRIGYQNWMISGAVSVPVKNLHGLQSEPATRVLFKLSHLL